ncbi:transcriptional regulator, TetR family [Streptomyces sp. LamerLS-316]|uniref:TetR/AcrR family transcriptional regulator n=1 Tax=unclassified Streptomyces TaxID=2593676 RepID=UPI0008237D70|nr:MULTISPECIES: TetR family transcriptional regulator [unclassified Streptomyces]SCK34498.1 transcriptional regulator, TetR family [Streptomyces sp. LamerLS-316]
MATRPQQSPRRTDALSKERIVEAAIEMLDAGGEKALTFRGLAARLATGSGAIYWHVANKDELLAAATDDVIARVVTDVAEDAEPRAAIRAMALGVFDAIDVHPWAGVQLSRRPWLAALPQLFEGFGGQLEALGVPERLLFDSTSALVGHVLGAAGQNAANGRLYAQGADRAAVLGSVAEEWARLDPERFPFVHRVAAQLPEHDDRDQFLTGVDLFVTGIVAARA